MSNGLYIGLMSGTSADAIDAALVSVSDSEITFESGITYCYPDSVRACILDLTGNPNISLADLCQLEQRISRSFANTVNSLLDAAKVASDDVHAIGSHGQTIIHQPTANPPFTLQLSDPSLIAHLTSIDTVADFRRADLAAGGQGAPLVPAFHEKIFGTQPDRIILNLGGIANITVLAGDTVTGFDTGPANTLLDAWSRTKTGNPYDDEGNWARTGEVDSRLLANLLSDDYFNRLPPKSSGPDYFSLEWLTRRSEALETLKHEDVQATLTELTAISAADAIASASTHGTPVLTCGGGVHNIFLAERLAHYVTGKVTPTSQLGIDSKYCEAMAFAWLAFRHKQALAGNLPSVTGAYREKILGGYYPKS